MKIALIGYGKMGKAIENIALQNGDEIVLKINSSNLSDLSVENIKQADVAIEFTNPESAAANIEFCLKNSIPVVSGSTGWTDKLESIIELCKEVGGTFLYASNFSLGVNIFFEINKRLATLMHNRKEYNVAIEEVHHTAKKDAPSGTAITLAEQVIKLSELKNKWGKAEDTDPGTLKISSIRKDPAPGTHHIKYHSDTDDIEIIHTAHNRNGFAQGAYMAAGFIKDKKGIFSMKDVLDIK